MNGLALVLGGAESLMDDVYAFYKLGFAPEHVIAINDAMLAYPWRITHGATLHPNKLWRDEPKWIVARRERDDLGDDPYTVYGHPIPEKKLAKPDDDPVAFTFQNEANHGSSGLYATQVVACHNLQSRAVVLCGVPMENGNHVGGVHKEHWQQQVQRYRPGWDAAYNEMADRVRSMSGWTRHKFGEPTVEWLTSRAESDKDSEYAATETA